MKNTHYKYFKLLDEAHRRVFDEYYEPPVDWFCNYELIDNLIGKIVENEYKNNITKLIYDILKCSSIIVLYQPYRDGNHKTVIHLMNILFSIKGYQFDILSAINDWRSRKLKISMNYTANDAEISLDSIKEFSRYIIGNNLNINKKI